MKQLYALTVNGHRYGRGNMSYMLELIQEWTETRDMYGAEEVVFKIEKTHPKEPAPLECSNRGFLNNR